MRNEVGEEECASRGSDAIVFERWCMLTPLLRGLADVGCWGVISRLTLRMQLLEREVRGGRITYLPIVTRQSCQFSLEHLLPEFLPICRVASVAKHAERY